MARSRRRPPPLRHHPRPTTTISTDCSSRLAGKIGRPAAASGPARPGVLDDDRYVGHFTRGGDGAAPAGHAPARDRRDRRAAGRKGHQGNEPARHRAGGRRQCRQSHQLFRRQGADHRRMLPPDDGQQSPARPRPLRRGEKPRASGRIWAPICYGPSARPAPRATAARRWCSANWSSPRRAMPCLGEILSVWVAERALMFRDWGQSIGLLPVACDALNLLTLSESCFYLSCGRSLAYRLVAMGSLAELFALCAASGRSAGRTGCRIWRAPSSRGPASGERRGRGRPSAHGTRAQIIEAAADIVAQQGLDGVTGRGVAQKADISLGSSATISPRSPIWRWRASAACSSA